MIARELKRYDIAIAALSETRIADVTETTERGSGYTFFCIGRQEEQPRQAGVGFAVKTCYLKLLDSLPHGVNERLMTMRLKLAGGYVTLISAYAPTMSHTQETKETFYEELDRLILKTPHSDKLLILGDFNARVGNDHATWEGVLGRHGIGKENANGTLLLSACAQHKLTVTNSLFQQRNLYKGTWMHPRSGHWHQIDFVITRQRDSQDIHLTRAMRGTTNYSDHRLLRTKVAMVFEAPKRHSRQPTQKKYNVARLSYGNIRKRLEEAIATELRHLDPPTDVEDHWKALCSTLQEISEKELGLAERAHRDWFDENDLYVTELLQKLNQTHLEYINDKMSATKKNAYLQNKRTAQKTLRTMKEEWWLERAQDIQAAADSYDYKTLFARLKAVYGPCSRGSSPLLSANGEHLLHHQEDILARWVEHFDAVLNRVSTISEDALDAVPQRAILEELDDPPSVTETMKAIKQMSAGKSPGMDSIPAEIYKHGGKVLAIRLTELFVSIWEHGLMPQEFKDALIIHLYKNKGDRRCCDNHRGISLLSVAGKILARIIINRLTRDITEHITPESQCGFRPSRGTTDMLFAARQVQEKCIEQKRDLFMVFIDLTKAFDSVGREGLWRLLMRAGCPPKMVRVIRAFHDGMNGRVVHEGNASNPFPITNGTKQGCVMAPVLFSIVFSAMLQDAFRDCSEGISICFRPDGSVFNLQRLKARTKTSTMLLRDLLYADDCALIAHTVEEAQSMVDAFSGASARYGLTISIQKTEVLHQPRPGVQPCNPVITIAGEPLRSVDKFCYLGGVLSQNGRIDDDITARINKASAAFGRLQHRLWKERGVRLSTKIKVYKAVVLTTLLYGGETWVQYRSHVKKLEQFHTRCLRRICGVSWKDRIPNTEILSRCKITSIEAMLTRAQLRWCGHVARMSNERIPKALFFGELAEGKRSTGGQRKRYKDVLKATLKAYNIDSKTWTQMAQDRARWRSVCWAGNETFEKSRTLKMEEKRRRRHAAIASPAPGQISFPCVECGKTCRSRIGLISHLHHRHHRT